jgi:hypothetical protein
MRKRLKTIRLTPAEHEVLKRLYLEKKLGRDRYPALKGEVVRRYEKAVAQPQTEPRYRPTPSAFLGRIPERAGGMYLPLGGPNPPGRFGNGRRVK